MKRIQEALNEKILILDEFFFKNGISSLDMFLIPNDINDTFL